MAHPEIHPWRKEPGPRVSGDRPLDSAKVQAPCIVRAPEGGFRLFYTAVGPGKPFPRCQGYLLSAVSEDGLVFTEEPGIRLAPQPELDHVSLRVLAPSIAPCSGGWRMYFEGRGPASRPPVICSAVSTDMLHWELEEGIRLQNLGGLGGPRYLPLAQGGRLFCCSREFGPGGRLAGPKLSTSVISARTLDGLHFDIEPGYRLRDGQSDWDGAGITAAEAIVPLADGPWTLIYSAWQDVPPGTQVPPHPSQDPAAEGSLDFAAFSIASDLAGYRSRIFVAHSGDGLSWEAGQCIVEGGGYQSADLDGVHAEDMSVIALDDGRYRMYYAACDRAGNWRIASAVNEEGRA
ncbi:MAG: hypothetical protein GKR89_21675 [Candidatus Latescibacteria bacterium]|nr:hypothetical protein [Candidatus Latescibacterota bacterium]